MLEQFLQLRNTYPPGSEIEVMRDGYSERTVVTEHRLTADAAYLVTLDCGIIHVGRVPEIVRKVK